MRLLIASSVRWMALLLLLMSGCAATQANVTGEWQGAFRFGSTWQPARLRLQWSGNTLTGTADVTSLNIKGAAVEGTVEGNKVRFQVAAPEFSKIVFEGTLEADDLNSLPSGNWQPPGFRFVRAAPLAPEAADEYTGSYALGEDGRVLVTRGAEGGLRFFNMGRRISGTLLPSSRDVFHLAYFDQAPTTLNGEARFLRDAAGRVVRLEIGGGRGTDPTILTRVAKPTVRQQYLSFQNGEIALRGMLLAPADGKKHPAVVFIHGTGCQTTDSAYEMILASGLLERGIAVMVFDKRGCGGSGGNWRTVPLAELATDVAAAVEALSTVQGIDPRKIGVYGISEGGWVAPIASAKSRKVAFVINQGGPAVGPLEDELDDLTAGVGRIGLAPEDRELAMNIARGWVELYRSPAGLAPYQAAIAAARPKPWFGPMESRLPAGEDNWEVQWWRKRGQLDPAAYWKTVRVPALVLIGENDDTMDRKKNLARFEEYRAAQPRIEVRVIPAADHGLRVKGVVPPAVLQEMADWILRAVNSPRPK